MMNAKLLILIILKDISSIYCWQAHSHDALCPSSHTCIPINQCRENNSIVYPCDLDLNHVCCPQHVDTRQTAAPLEAFPENCGIIPIIDRITMGKEAALGQFPWMALLGYTQQELDLVQFLCGGTLITNQYVLTAAHCLGLNSNLILSVVRLGESDLKTDIDCDGNQRSPTCALPPVDVAVNKSICHPNYNNVTFENDIAILKLKNPVNYTLYVLPICLPFKALKMKQMNTNDQVLISGWGKTFTDQVGGSTKLMFATVYLWDSVRCNNSLPLSVKPLKNSQICANGNKSEDSCNGDSGGPMTNAIVVDGDLRNFQIGIVSFSSSQICGDSGSPTVYTKVEYYLDWITDNVNKN